MPDTQYEEDKNEEQVIDNLGDERVAEDVIYDISSYGADYPAESLVDRIKRKDIVVPDFQRGFVWTMPRASKFIESLLLGLPVPGIFLSRSTQSTALMVIDGQQRLRSLQAFYTGRWPGNDKTFRLKGVDKRFNEKTYEELDSDSRRLLNDSIIHATIVKQNSPGGNTGIYHIFQRLNSGGVTLAPQEIRSAIYFGNLNDVIQECNALPSWRKVFGKVSPRKRDEELILRYFALQDDWTKYDSPMSEFLNKYMETHRADSIETLQRRAADFDKALQLILQAVPQKAFRTQKVLNAAFFDSFTLAVVEQQVEQGAIDLNAIAQAHDSLTQRNDFLNAITKSTADKERVTSRINIALEALYQHKNA